MKARIYQPFSGSIISLFLLLLALPLNLLAGLTYENNGSSITITGSDPKASGNLVIPGTIDGLPVAAIDYASFHGSTGLTSVTIPSSVTSVGERAFKGCTGLTNFTVLANNPAFSSRDGVIFNKAQTSLIAFPEGKRGGYAIPNTVTSIGAYAFGSCIGLTNVTIPTSVKSIGEYGFEDCSGLTSITLPNSVTSVGLGAFANCYGLKTVTIPNSVTSIGASAFSACSGLTSITLPNGIPSISSFAFESCTGLTSVAIPSSVTSIGAYAFSYCTALTSLTIPNSVVSIGNGAFEGCAGLTSITIPSSVTSIGSWAFVDCSALTGVNFMGNAPIVDFGVFSGSPNVQVYYILGKAGWSNTFSGQPTATFVPQIAPVITSPTVATVTVGQPFSYTITANNGATGFAATGLPSGLTLNPSTGTISGTPTLAGTHTINLSASNPAGVGTKTLTLTIRAPDLAKPTVVIATPAANVHTTTLPLTISGTATDNVAVATVEYRIENATGTNAYSEVVGTTAWTAAVTLAPGASTIRVRARDTSGNLSPEVTRVFYYDIAKPLLVNVVGSGIVTPNLNTSNLVVGKTYSMTATVQKGTTFDGWTGYGATPIKTATLSFVMTENLSLTAKFVDLAKPTVAISTPAANTRTTTLPLTITGTATDNLALSAVEYRVETASGTNAYGAAAGTTAWTIAVPLAPGASTIRVRARDASGNLSPEVTRVFYYDIAKPLSVTVVGSGLVTPNLNTSNLVVGKTYSMTATVQKGTTFDGWTGYGATTNKTATLSFVMAENLSLTAKFVDLAKPTVVIATPAANTRTTTLPLTISGTATDNLALSAVEYRIENASGTNAYATAAGTTAWTAAVTLAPGASTIRVRARDASGNLSPDVTRVFYYDIAKPLSVTVVGSGLVTPNLNTSKLVVGKTYSMTATTQKGTTFDGWTGYGASTNKTPTLSFVMAENLSITAKFVDLAKPTIAISTPAANTRTTTLPLTITGTATDNLALSAVEYRVETASGTNAYGAAAGTTAWTIAVPLAPGASTIRVRARDASGNLSPEVTRVFYYDIAKPLSVNVVGSGIVTPNLNTSNLVVGKTYSMTATVQKGTTFDGWTGYGTTPIKTATISFVMAENLSLTAKFVDKSLPSLVISTPANNSKITTHEVLVKGTAGDNLGVSKVMVRIDSGEWMEATGTTAWSHLIQPGLGNHTVSAYALDAAGNASPTKTVAIRLPDYRGIYFGTYSGLGERGLIGVIVTADQRAIMLAGDNTSAYGAADAIGDVPIALDGAFDYKKPNGVRLLGTFTDTGFSITAIHPGLGSIPGSGLKKVATGKHSALVGLYYGTYNFSQDDGEVAGLVAADGQTLVLAESSRIPEESIGSGGASLGSVDDRRQVKVMLNGTSFNGSIDPQTFVISGLGFSMERLTTPDGLSPQLAPSPELDVPNELEQTMDVIQDATPIEVPILRIQSNVSGFGFVFSTQVGRTYRIQSSTDLLNWNDLTETFTADAEEYEFSEPEVEDAHRFYRVVAK